MNLPPALPPRAVSDTTRSTTSISSTPSSSTTVTLTVTTLVSTTTSLQRENELWPVECEPPCRCSYWSRSSNKLRFNTVKQCQNRADNNGHVFFTYNPSSRKCVTGNECFYDRRTYRQPTSRQWQAHKRPGRQGTRLSTSAFITPAPDYLEEGEEESLE